MTSERPRDLVGWMHQWCERPGMWLATLPDGQSINVDMLFALITGYETALHQLGQPSEHEAFREFVHSRRPEFRKRSDWYGGALFRSNGDGDHLRVIDQIREWVDELDRARSRDR